MMITKRFARCAMLGARLWFLQLCVLFPFLVSPTPTKSALASPHQQRPRLLTRAEQIRNLTLEEAKRGYSVRLRGVVTYFDPDPDLPDLFIQDSTAGIWVDISNTRLMVKPGQLVEVQGVTAAPDFAPQVSRPRVQVLGQAPMPVARRVSFGRMASTKEDSQWVEVEGIVHKATKQDQRLFLDVARPWVSSGSSSTLTKHGERLILDVVVGMGRVKVQIPDFHQPVPAQLVDAKVRVRGVCGAIYNQKSQLLGVVLYAPRLAAIQIEEPAPADPFALPARPIASLLRFSPQGSFGHCVRVQGAVTLQQPGKALFIKDETEALHIQTEQMTPVQAGDLVDVVGFPAAGEYSAIFEDAIFRRIGTGPPPTPIAITPAQALDGSHDSQLVRIQAGLLGATLAPGKCLLNMEAGNVIFVAQVEEAQSAKCSAALAPGSLVLLKGICMVETDTDRNPQAFRVLLRSWDNIVLLRHPPWWTIKRMVRVMTVMAALILGILLWVMALRKRVAEQTRTVRKELEREAALRARYHELFENANDMIFTCDLTGHLTSLNKAGERISGYTRAEAIGKSIAQMAAPEHLAVAEQMVQCKVGGEEQRSYELEIIANDGHRVPLETRTRFICAGGKPAAVQGIARDITERKWAEERVREAEARYRGLVENIPAVTYMAAPNETSTTLYVSPQIESWLGIPQAEWVADANLFFKQLHPDDRERVLANLSRSHATGKPFRCEYRLVARDGRIVWVRDEAVVIRDNAGQPVFTQGIMLDITERKLAEQALRESEEKYRTLFEQSQDAIVITTREGQFVDVNQAALALFGYTGGEMLALSARQLYANPADRLKFQRKTEGKGSVSEYEIKLRKKDGTKVDCVISSSVRLSNDGEIFGYQSIIRDITQRKKAERTLRELSGRILEVQDNERRRIARELHDSTAQNLAALTMNLAWLLKSAALSDRKARKVLSESQAAAEGCMRELRTVSHLLHPPLLDQIGLGDAIRHYVAGFADRSGIRVELEVPPRLSRVSEEAELASFRIVQESLTNIHRHSGSKTAKIRMSCSSTHLRLEIKDKGRGVPRTILQRLDGTDGKFGVGIASMRERLTHLGGQLEIDSSSRGTTVRAILPLDKNSS